MKVTLIWFKESPVDIFPELMSVLKKRISGFESDVRFAPFVEDLPELAQEASEDSDFIFVFALVSENRNIGLVEEKLIDVEIETKTRILKVIREDDMSSADRDEFAEEKEQLVDEFAELIVNILFNENKFAPQEPDFDL
jgi:riboflavin synthase